MDMKFDRRLWWEYIGEDLRGLLLQSQLLVKESPEWKEKFDDYSFVVFPASKAYEGFLKKLFLDLGFISKDDYFGTRFRIGKALNPNLDKDIREKESVYDRLVEFCHGPALADKLWLTWKQCRNSVFHWFPNQKNTVSFEEAKDKVVMVVDAIDSCFEECKIKLGKKNGNGNNPQNETGLK